MPFNQTLSFVTWRAAGSRPYEWRFENRGFGYLIYITSITWKVIHLMH